MLSRARALGRLAVERARDERALVRRATAAPDGLTWPYEGLSPLATSLSRVRPQDGAPARLNLFLPSLEPSSIFAGLRTAMSAAAALSKRICVPVRVIAPTRRPAASARAALATMSDLGAVAGTVEFVPLDDVADCRFAADDYWIATYWTTAHALDVACRAHILDKGRVIYLIQDHEPSFFAASTARAVARSTYRAGFTPLVNSSPLAHFLHDAEGIDPSRFVFAPELDLGRLREAAAARRRTGTARVMFYGRPSKPRNMFWLGISALRSMTAATAGVELDIFSVGEQHRPVRLSETAWLRSHGTVSWVKYFEMLSQADVVLSLQSTPHPSHPPLDAVASGARAVTNEVSGTRALLHPRLVATEPEPLALAEALIAATARDALDEPAPFSPSFLSALGDPMDGVLDRLARSMSLR